ncbi:MAG: S1C family serine protease [Eubacteriales bacterium]
MDEQKEPQEGFSFLQEVIKEDRRKKSLPKIIFMCAVLGVVFGVTSSATFVVVKPWIEAQFAEEEVISIPSDEELIDENVEIDQEVMDEVKAEVKDEVMEEIKDELTSDTEQTEASITDYEKIYQQLYEVAQEAAKSIVTVQVEYTAEEEAQLALSVLEGEEVVTVRSVTGLVVATTSSEILILSPTYIFEDTDKIKVKLSDGVEVLAQIKAEESILGYAILSIDKDSVDMNAIEVAVLGNSLVVAQGEVTIAIGNQFDYEDGLGYGVISSTKNQLNLIDGSYSLISTDIPVGVEGTGILLNTSGEVIGLINTILTDETAVDALSISQLKVIIEALSNGEDIPYMGVKTVQVTEEIAEQQLMPIGIYVQSVEAYSPALEAGIKNGDIITSVNGIDIIDTTDYQNALLNTSPGDIIEVLVQRKGKDEYVEISIIVTIGIQQ